MKQLLLTILFFTFVLPLTAQSAGEMITRPPKYEVRAAWVTAVYGLDWPRRHPKTKGRTSRDT